MIEFYNYPQVAKIQQYDKVRNIIKNYYSNCESLIAIYEYGKVSAPGVSDLDLIFVFNENEFIGGTHSFDFRVLGDDAHDLVKYGNIIIMPDNCFKRIHYLDAFNLSLIYGNPVETETINPHQIIIRNTVSILDWLPERVARVCKVINDKKIDVVNTLCLLNSLTYSVQNIERLLKIDMLNQDIYILISKLRESWLEVNLANEKLLFAINELIDAAVHASNSFKDKHFSSLINNEFGYFEINKKRIEIPIHFNQKIILEGDQAKISKRNGDVSVSFPLDYYIHFAILSSFDNLISSEIRKKIPVSFKAKSNIYNGDYTSYLKIKTNIISDNFEYLKKNNLNSGLIRYGQYVK